MSKSVFRTQLNRENVVEQLERYINGLDQDLHNIKQKVQTILKDQEKQEELVQCPHFRDHLVPKGSFDKHVAECLLRIKGADPQLVPPDPPSSHFAYENAPAVSILNPVIPEIPIMEIEPEYDVWSLYFPQPNELQQQKRNQNRAKNMPRSLNNMPEVVIVDEKDDMFSIIDKDTELPNYPYPKIKNVIWGWKKIPLRVKYLDVAYVSKERIINWIYKNVIKYSRLFQTPEDYDYLYTIVLQNDPDNIVKFLTNKMGDKTQDFVVDIWKIVAFELLEIRHKYLVQTGQVVEPVAPIETEIDPSKVTNEVSLGYEGLPARDRYQQYLHDVHISSQLQKVKGVKPITIDFSLNSRSKVVEVKPKTELELLQEQRDYKRRRTKYRARNVHITKRTPTEVARDIINERMEELGATIERPKDKDSEAPPPPPPDEPPRPPRRDDRPPDHRDDRRNDRREDRRDERREERRDDKREEKRDDRRDVRDERRDDKRRGRDEKDSRVRERSRSPKRRHL